MVVGDAVKVIYHGTQVFGRIERIDGGTFHVRTPGGSLVRAGFIWLRHLASAEDLAQLQYWDDDAACSQYDGCAY